MHTPRYLEKIFSAFLFIAGVSLSTNAQAPMFYGMTNGGGSNTYGMVFSFNPATNAETVVHSFINNANDGTTPYGSLVLNPTNNVLYGMTYSGGLHQSGSIFIYNPATGADSTVYSFAGIPDGSLPWGDLTYNETSGLFYGMTQSGGSNYASNGVIFSFNPVVPFVDSVRYRFSSPPDTLDAINPYGKLIYNASANLYYGMSPGGGTHNYGAIFSFDPATNTENILHNFTNAVSEPANPQGNLTYYPNTGEYYGLSKSGGANGYGSVFRFDPSNSNVQIEYSFTSTGDAKNPVGDLIYWGSTGLFYGVTYQGGSHNVGAVFSFNPTTNAENVLYSFDTTGSDTQSPVGNLVYDGVNQLFYGMSYSGGSNKKGTIFSFNPSTSAVNTVWSFGADSDGVHPLGSLILLNGPNGINAVNKQDETVNIYPNPSTSAFTVTGLQTGQTVELSNYLGQQISRFVATGLATQQFDISSLANGIYLLQVINADGNTSGFKKMVKTN